jgi:hypothetical protein
MKYLILLLILLTTYAYGELISYDDTVGKYKAYDTVTVSVYLNDDLRNVINESTIQSKIEIELRKNGIELLNPDKPDHTKNHLLFWLECSALLPDSGKGVCAYSIKFMTSGHAFLPNSAQAAIILYEDSTFGTIGSSKLHTLAGDYEDFLYTFINDWQKAHPAKP